MICICIVITYKIRLLPNCFCLSQFFFCVAHNDCHSKAITRDFQILSEQLRLDNFQFVRYSYSNTLINALFLSSSNEMKRSTQMLVNQNRMHIFAFVDASDGVGKNTIQHRFSQMTWHHLIQMQMLNANEAKPIRHQ